LGRGWSLECWPRTTKYRGKATRPPLIFKIENETMIKKTTKKSKEEKTLKIMVTHLLQIICICKKIIHNTIR